MEHIENARLPKRTAPDWQEYVWVRRRGDRAPFAPMRWTRRRPPQSGATST